MPDAATTSPSKPGPAAPLPPPETPTTRPPIIELRDVTRRFPSNIAVEKLSFEVREGEIVALVGRTGAGKSTALNLVMGTLPVSEGVVRVAGLDPYLQFKQLRGQLSVSFQTDRLLPWLTARENVEVGLRILRKSKAEMRATSDEWLGRVKLDGSGERYPHELSGGMRQRVSLARALAIDPAILLLDESFSQLDHVTSAALRHDVSVLVRSLRKTCLLITHRIDDALEMADRILVLAAPARVVGEFAPSEADRADPQRISHLHAEIAAALLV